MWIWNFSRSCDALFMCWCCPDVGRLCDGACTERIGGTFHTFGASWWGVGGSLMNASTWLTNEVSQPPWHCHGLQIKALIPAVASHTLLLLLLRLLLLEALKVFLLSCSVFDSLQSALHEELLTLAPIRTLELPVSPDAHGEPWSFDCGIFHLISSAQSSGAACRFLPAKFINPVSGSNWEAIRERRSRPLEPAVTLFSVKWD